MSVCHLSVITHKYKSARQELLVSIFNSPEITHEQCASHVAQAQHASYLQIFPRYKALLAFFKLGHELYCTRNIYILYTAKLSGGNLCDFHGFSLNHETFSQIMDFLNNNVLLQASCRKTFP